MTGPLSDKQKKKVIEDIEREERYQKCKMSILGLSQYKMTEEDYIFLTKERDFLNTELWKELGIKERIMSERDVAYDKIKKIEAEKVDLFDIGIREKKRAIKAENDIIKLEKELEKYNLKDYEERHEKAVKGS